MPGPLTGDGPPRTVRVGLMTLSVFEVLGVFPELGRLPTPEEDAPGGPSVALLSHDLWASQYGSDPAIVGRIINMNGTPREVIGVMPASYDFPTPEVDLWALLRLDPASSNFGGHYISAIARLAPGVTTEAASGDARSLIARFTTPSERLLAARTKAYDANFHNDAAALQAAVVEFDQLANDPAVGRMALYYAAWTEWALAASLVQAGKTDEAIQTGERVVAFARRALQRDEHDPEVITMLVNGLIVVAVLDRPRLPSLAPEVAELGAAPSSSRRRTRGW